MTNFNSTWDTTNTGIGSSNADQIKLPLEATGTYNFTVNWGDGNEDIITAYDQAEVTHTYASSGSYDISISGTIRGFRFNDAGDKLKLTDISQWGDLRVGNNNGYFLGCSNFNSTATDSLDLTGTTNMSYMFYSASAFNGDISAWDVSSITNMYAMFHSASAFNGDISAWDVSSITNMSYMFRYASAFNGDISAWDVSSVTNMEDMFYDVTLTTNIYDNILISWAIILLKNGVLFHGGDSKYSYAAIDARNYMIIHYGWTISDGGQSDDIQPAWFQNWASLSYSAEKSYTHNPDDVIDASGAVLAIGTTKESIDELADRSGNNNHGKIYGAMPTEGFIQGRRFDGGDDYIDCGNDSSLDTIEFTYIALVNPHLLAGTSRTIIGNSANNTRQFRLSDSGYLQFLAQGVKLIGTSDTAISINKYSCITLTYNSLGNYIFSIDGVNVGSGNYLSSFDFYDMYIGKYNVPTQSFNGNIVFVKIINSVKSVSNIFNTLARLPFWSVNYIDYPDNAAEYSDNLPYSSTIISSGTFKVDADVLDCVSAGTMTYSASYDFDGSEFLKVTINGTEYAGTGTVTHGTTTVSVAQGSNKITIVAGTGDTIDRIDAQFRKEV